MRIRTLTLTALLCLTLNSPSQACTDFRLTAKDGTVIVTRSMEFAIDMKSNLRTSNQGRAFSTNAPNNRRGLGWTAKFGYVYLDGLGVDAAIDGMNEKGLTFEALYLPGNAGYQTVPTNRSKNAIAYISLGDWILGNFDNVDDVKKALENIFVFAQTIPGTDNMIFPLHFSVFDQSGKGIVIEYVDGKRTIYDNTLGVLTNSPTYNWHLTNLANYIHLTPENPKPVLDNGVTFAATGQGYGMIGIPGDISPPSRFVKTATMLRVVLPAADASGALNLAEHVINNVDIPLGLVREPYKGSYTNESTQWVVFKDLTHKIFYYRTYDDLTLRSVDLSKINFSHDAPRLQMPIANPQFIQDKTNDFLAAKES